ncbi:MAG: class I SAM-dependent methyltransferase [Gammaproteobacteria bacterium]|nr:class I SAM-dependent methyltransferase [Gammaproteobacteria bacterium]MBU1480865.1 class I SAM-dependent methyltransferase [Gammaproteobacteria bacterium]
MDATQEPATLVFPASHPDGREYLEVSRERDERVVAASSVWDAGLATHEGELAVLPYVDDPEFPARFLALVQQHNITRIYAPVAAAYSWLERFIAEQSLSLRLIGSSPIKREIERFDRLMAKVSFWRAFIDQCAGGKSDLSDIEIAAAFRMSSHIYGESNEQKIAAMMAIFASAPKGDVVEVGSLVGKSAAVLALLARRYNIGNVLAIDPWQAAAATQHDSPETVRVGLVNEWRWDVPPQDFAVNTYPIGFGSFNYLQQESVHGCEIFKKEKSVHSPTFGHVDYEGRIAVMHIDGNHDYAQVKQDCESWLPLLDPNGWLILDDYVWVHGDGPKRVGDALLQERAGDIERSFECGKALFIKFRG